MTFAYSATNHAWSEHIEEEYKEIFRGANYVPNSFYLAEKIRAATVELLPGPAAVMSCIQKVAKDFNERGKILEWESPTGFPVANDYRKPNVRTISIRDGHRFQFRIADGALPDINRKKVISAAAPNFVHSLDAAHLIRVVNRANDEGVTNLLTIHDSFACLAPQAEQLGKIVREELGKIYTGHRIGLLPLMNMIFETGVPDWLPPFGGLDPTESADWTYCF